MNVSSTPTLVADVLKWIRTRNDCLQPVLAITSRLDDGPTLEVRIEWRVVQVFRMRITSKIVGLPQIQGDAFNRLAIGIDNATANENRITDGRFFSSIDPQSVFM